MAALAPPSSRFEADSDWRLAIVAGTITAGVGILVLAKPGQSLKALAVIAGIYLLLDSVLAFIVAVSPHTANRELPGLHAVLSLVTGLILVRHPVETVTAIALLIGIWLIAVGCVRLVGSVNAARSRGWLIAIALVQLVAGIVIVGNPDIGYNTLALIAGISLTLQGCTLVALGWAGRSMTTAPARVEATRPI